MDVDEKGVIEVITRYKFITEAEVHSAEFDAKRHKGEKTTLDVLIENKLVNLDQVRRIASRLGKVRPVCFKCLRLASFGKDEFLGDFKCPFCSEAVSFKQGTAGQVEELLPNPPDRAVDKIVEKLLKKAGFSVETLAGLKKQVKATVPRPTLLELLQSGGHVPQTRVFQLKGKAEALLRKKIENWGDLRQDYQLGRFLCMLQAVNHRKLSDLLQHQFEDVIKKGTYKPLRETLKRTSDLTDYQMRKFLPAQFDDRPNRQKMIDMVEAEVELPYMVEERKAMQDSLDDSMDEILVESRDLRIILPDPEEDD